MTRSTLLFGLCLIAATSLAQDVKKVGKDGLAFEGRVEATDAKIKFHRFGSNQPVERPAKLFVVELTANKMYRIAMDSADLDSLLVVQSNAGVQLALDDDSGGGNNALLQFAALESGLHKIYAIALEGTGKFSLKIVEQGDLQVHDVGGGLSLDGRLAGFAQTYYVKLTAGTNFAIDMIAAEQTLDPFLLLFDAQGRLLAKDDDGGGGLNARITHRAASTGGYKILATFADKKGTGAYTLKVRAMPAGEGPILAKQDLYPRILQANALSRQEKHQESMHIWESILPSMERHFGANSADYADSLNNLGSQLYYLGRYKEADHYFRLALQIRERIYGKDHMDVAASLRNLALVHGSSGQYLKALAYSEQSLAIKQARLGRNHLEVAMVLNTIGWLHMKTLELEKAEPNLQECLRIREATLGKNHELVAEPLQNLGLLFNNLGQYDKAEAYYLRCLQIREAANGPEDSSTAHALNELANNYNSLKRYDKALPLHLRAIQILERRLGRDHPDVAFFLTNLAFHYRDKNELPQAETTFKRALEIREAKLDKNDPMLAISYFNLGATFVKAGQPGQALPLFQRGLEIQKKSLGKDHPHVIYSLNRLGWALGLEHKWTEAVDSMHDARQREAAYYASILPSLSEREQLIYLKEDFQERLHESLSLAWSAPKPTASLSAEWLLNGKALTHQTLAEQQLLARDSKDPGAEQAVKRLQDVRSELAALVNRSPTAGRELEYQKDMAVLRTQERDLAEKLARAVGKPYRSNSWITLDELRAKLPAKSVFVDIARFHLHDLKTNKPLGPRYAAWITPSKGDVQLIDLGEAEPIDQLVDQMRAALLGAPKDVPMVGEPQAVAKLTQSLQELSTKVLHPLLKTIGESEEWIVCPDGALWLAPWSALLLPDGKYAVEKHRILHVVSGRDLVLGAAQHKASAPFIFADPDFGGAVSILLGKRLAGTIGAWKVSFEFQPSEVIIYDEDERGAVAGKGTWSHKGNQLSVKTAVSQFEATITGQQIKGQRTKKNADGSPAMDDFLLEGPLAHGARLRASGSVGIPFVRQLPFTAVEAEAVQPKIASWLGSAPTLVQDKDATKTRVKAIRHPRLLVLATHGYFLPTQEIAPQTRHESNQTRSVSLRDSHGHAVENPLLRCGLLLAGCNKRLEAKPGADDGILTGLEIVGMDLRGCELVVLSACETGLGDVRSGEGVAGLRQAFQLAGAKNVLSSLWQVPDRETALLMTAFYGALAEGKSQAAALREAQLARISARKLGFGAAHPFFWAAFTMTSRGGD